MGQKILGPTGSTWRNSGRLSAQHCGGHVTKRRAYTNTIMFISSPNTINQETLLSNFDFHHYPPIQHCLKDQWWAPELPLLVEMTFEDVAKLFKLFDCFPKLHNLATKKWYFGSFYSFWIFSWMKREKIHDIMKLHHVETYHCFIFCQERLQNFKKLTKNSQKYTARFN